MTSTEIDDAYEALLSRIDARARIDARDAPSSFAPPRARVDGTEKKIIRLESRVRCRDARERRADG